MNILSVVKNHEDELLHKKNVVAIAEGEKWSNGQNTHHPSLLVFVSQKEDEGKLLTKDRIPKIIDGVETDVVGKTGVIKALSYTQKVRPIQPGYSIGHYKITAGTLGGIFIDKDGDVVGLSNNHVLANENNSKKWDPIYQPGSYDGGKDVVGKLKNMRSLVYGGRTAYNGVLKTRINYNTDDSALCLLTGEVNTDIPEIGKLSGFNDNPKVGDKMRKTGRTTGYMEANITAINAIVRVQFDIGVLTFKDQIITNYMSDGGDSGSLGVDEDNNATGLLFAGSDTTTIFNPIKYPREGWGLKIYNKVDLDESINYQLKIDDQLNNASYDSIPSALNNAKELAKSGHSVELITTYRASPR